VAAKWLPIFRQQFCDAEVPRAEFSPEFNRRPLQICSTSARRRAVYYGRTLDIYIEPFAQAK
jgi:hypothetical protein